MAIQSGTRLGPYEVLSAIGAGGMGEVYKARDTRLNRNVALKVLPEAFSRDAQRMARFEREAKLLASLNHPNIAAIYGLEESGPIRALVMELVEGPTLAERILGGAIPVDEALPIARQVADAVEYAHDKNVIHRDLKPANIKVTTDGMVKVLDFGLAKAMSDEPSAVDISNSPTLSMAATRQGVILGTAAYMSPEQARGKNVDKRADIWSFGVVLYEMLTGKQLFEGDDVAAILAGVIRHDPDLTPVPLQVRPLLQRCLEKDPRQRLRDIGEARIALARAGDAPGEPTASQPRRSLVLVAVTTMLGLAFAAVSFVHFREPPPKPPEPMRFFVSPPDTWDVVHRIDPLGISPAPLAVSPDGRRIAFAATSADGKTLLWIRSLDTLAAQSLVGTDGATSPFWSPDSRFLGFFAGGKLKKIEVSGGPPISLCDTPNGSGATWSRDGVIVFNAGRGSALRRVSAAGGVPTAVTVLGEGETGHVRPSFLPDGRHFLYRAITATGTLATIYLASLDSAGRKLFPLAADATPVVYSAGHLLFLRETTLMVQPFDARRLQLTGEAFPIAEQIQTVADPPNGIFSASENGMLAYQTGTGATGSQLAWIDRDGKPVATLGDLAAYGDLELSPDHKQVAVSIPDQTGGARDIWLYDVARGLRTRFTFDPAEERAPVWSPDGSRVVFSSIRKGHRDLYQKTASGAGTEEVLLEDNLDKYPVSWSPDGRLLLYRSVGITTASDLWVLPLAGDRKPIPFLNTQFVETNGRFSPDGKWVAYASNESGRPEVYVAPFPGPGGKRQVSTAGGDYPRWGPTGAEIFYLAPDRKLMSASVNGKGASFEVGVVKPLFDAGLTLAQRYPYDVSADGQRFLVNTVREQAASVPITVIVNWTAGLKK